MKKTFVRLLAVAMCVVMALTAAPLGGFVGLDLPSLFDFKAEASKYSGTCGDNLTWSLDTSTGVLNITGTGAMTDWSSSSSVPWYSYRSYVKAVNIASGVTTIGDNAFTECTNLTGVIIPDSVITIGNSAFSYCDNLKSITIPDSVITIGDYAFESCCSLEDVNIGNSVKTIGVAAFCDCTVLTSITIPDSVTSIGEDAFHWCFELSSVTGGNGVITIGEEAFYECVGLTSIILGDSVTTIGNNAFAHCVSLKNITLPDSLTSIGARAFYYCLALTDITIPAEVKEIKSNAFGDCTALTSITVDANNKYYTSDSNGVLFNKDKTELVRYPAGNTRTSYNIPEGVTKIGDDALNVCHNLTSITIPDGVTSIGEQAFNGCFKLTDITIPASVTKIEDGAFFDCNNLTDVYYGSTEEDWNKITIGYDNELLTSATIHFTEAETENVIDSGVCGDNLTWTLYESGLLEITGTGAMTDWSYYSSAPWESYGSDIKIVNIANGVTTIGNYAFSACENLASVTISDSVTTIGNYAFFSRYSLKSITIPDSVITIGEYAFSECESLTSVTIPDSVTTIGLGAFYECVGLTSVILGNSVTTIGNGAFTRCVNLKNVTLPDSVTTIQSRAFFECYAITDITIPAGVKKIESNAFGGCESLTSITVDANNKYYTSDSNGVLYNKDKTELVQYPVGNTRTSYNIPEGVTKIGDDAFSSCYNLTSITIPDGVTSIGGRAFDMCGGLRDITIPESVTQIGYAAFMYCRSLVSVTILGRVTELESSVFTSCSKLTDITIPDSVTSISGSAFAECNNLTNVYYGSTEEDWNKITIASYNEPLTSATIHFTEPEDTTIVSGECGENLTWTLDTETGVLNITGTGAMADWLNYSYAPWYSYNESIKTVNIASGITTIGDFAFLYCDSLTSVTIGDNVTTIGENAFEGCTSLTSVTIPDSVTTIGEYAFFDCAALTSLTIPASVTAIGECAFDGCISLANISVDANNKKYSSDSDGVLFNKDKTELVQYPVGNTRKSYTLPDGVTTIGEAAFYYCKFLTSVTIPDSVTTIGRYAFYKCTNLTDVYYSSTEEKWNEITIGSDNESLNSTTIHFTESDDTPILSGDCGENLIWTLYENGLLEITGTGAMTNWSYYSRAPWYSCNERIKTVNIASGVTTIGDYAFAGCENLSDIAIPDTVTYIGDSAFDSAGLTSIIIPDSVEHLGDSVFFYCSNLEEATIGNGVDYIGVECFYECSNLKNATIGNGAAYIGEYCFFACSSLKNVILGNNIKYIEEGAFFACEALANIRIPGKVKTIGESAFSCCYNLESVAIPSSVTRIDADAFRSGYNTVEVFYASTEEDWNNINIDSGNDLFDEATFYYINPDWNYNYGTCGDNLTWEFDTRSGLLKIDGEGAEMYTGDKPWYAYRKFIVSVQISDSVTNIDDYAFEDCSNLTSIIIPDGVTYIGDWAFENCQSLTSIAIPDGVTYIGDWAFNNCQSLTSIAIPDGVTYIGDGAFYSCQSLASITIHDGVTYIGHDAFYDSGYYNDVSNWEDDVLYIGKYLVNVNSDKAGDYHIKNGTLLIADDAFYICENLTSVNIPDSVTTIGNRAFGGCSKLADVYYGSTEEDWNKISIASGNEPLTSATIHFAEQHTHTYIWIVVTEPTTIQRGLKKRICSECGYELYTISIPALSFVSKGEMKIDHADNTIYGFTPGLDSLDSYTTIPNGASWHYTETQYGFGTGTVATIKNGDKVVAEYTVLIFGDIDGNGWYDANDAFIVNMIASGLVSADRLSAAQFRAADCNHDGAVDSADFYLLNQASLMLEDIDQSATQAELATNAMYIGYCSLIDQTAGEETNLVPMPDYNEIPSDNTADTEQNKPADETDFEAIFTAITDFFKKIFEFFFSFIIN